MKKLASSERAMYGMASALLRARNATNIAERARKLIFVCGDKYQSGEVLCWLACYMQLPTGQLFVCSIFFLLCVSRYWDRLRQCSFVRSTRKQLLKYLESRLN